MLYKLSSFVFLCLLFQTCSTFSGKGKRVADEFFKPMANTYITVNASSATSTNNLKKGFYHYQQGEYQEALNSFNKSNTTGNPRLKLYMSVAQIALKRYKEAEVILKSLIGLNQFGQAEAAYWYLALAYLYQEKIPAAEAIFQSFATREPGNYKQTDAVAILDRLKK